ncbi:V-type ATP synthase subunit F [Methanothermococcus okinawensis]|uniref:A-type ATP synthase subunit F n=1 Tax=Methanothermococcus okinawensis (strain DSM 14208 / JCM 11175 / IH1) TaxID=647113 RepID=F8AK42_METOI|nr:V-type ATP synthase subunit F [Methanothermococcus okinawensis]AEH07409.1 V-type ATP synthase subunit F [Methanothermococcus okinawensis IH1]
MKIGVVGDLDMTIGFRLAGLVDVYEVKNNNEAIDALKKLSSREDIGLIIIPEKIGESIRDELSKLNKFVVEVPDKNGPIVRENDPVKELVRKAVGIELK